MTEIDTRKLADGSGTEVALWHLEGDRFAVVVVNNAGYSSGTFDRTEAGLAFRHPFSHGGLDYPGVNVTTTPVTDAAEAITAEFSA